MIEVERSGGQWIASCEGRRAVTDTAAAALEAVVLDGESAFGDTGGLRAWIRDHAANFEREAGAAD